MFCVLNKIKIISLSYLLLKLFTIKIVTVSCDTLYIYSYPDSHFNNKICPIRLGVKYGKRFTTVTQNQ